MRTRKKFGLICMVLGVLLVVAAILLLVYNRWENDRAGESAAEIQSTLAEIIAENTAEYRELDAGMDTVEIDGNAYIGMLTIPSLDLELPILAEWSTAGLKIAPGRYYGSVWTDDLVICGHNYTRHFGNLNCMERGEALYFTDVHGTIFYYEVEEVVVLQPTDVEEMVNQSEEWDLTLFTCTMSGQARVTVRCSRTD